MAYDFTADDVFEMAEKLERNGAQFYRKAAENAGDSEAKAFLIRLAEMEDSPGKIALLSAFDPVRKSPLHSLDVFRADRVGEFVFPALRLLQDSCVMGYELGRQILESDLLHPQAIRSFTVESR